VKNVCVQKLSDLPDLSQARVLVEDTETSGFYPHHGDRVCGVAIGALDSDTNYYVPVRHQEHPGPLVNLPPENVFAWLGDLVGNPNSRVVGQNLKFDMTFLRYEGVEFKGNLVDTMLLAHIVDGNRFSYELDSLCQFYVPDFSMDYINKFEDYKKATQPEKKLPDNSKLQANYSLIPIWEMAPYACGDIAATRALAKVLHEQPMRARVHNQGHPSWSQAELRQHDMKVMRVLFEMEWTGVKIDRDRCLSLRQRAVNEMDFFAYQMKQLSGFGFDPLKWSVLDKAFSSAGGQVKYWSLPKKDKGKQKLDHFTTDKSKSTGRPCWNSMAIYKYIEEFKQTKNEKAMQWIKAYREFTQRQRLVATNIDAYLAGMDKYDRLHGQFHLHRVLTGRLSSSDPNLQNCAKPKGTLDQKLLEKLTGEKNEEALNRKIRSLFIPEKGNVWVSQDFSQIEYRAAAYFAQDSVIIGKYRDDPKTDYHEATAQICGITDRDHAKTTNFGILYGMGAPSLASLLMIPVEQARAILDKVYDTRPALQNFLRDTANWVKRHEFVQNPYGRICHVDRDWAYKGVNALVQGFVGDMMREAIVNVYDFIKENKLPVKMMLTIHDELGHEMPKEAVREIAPQLAVVMCASKMMPTVPILADVEVGPNWGTLKSLEEAA
jgi:DNA polymerase-1